MNNNQNSPQAPRSTYRNSVSGLTRELTPDEAHSLNLGYEELCRQNPYAALVRWEKVTTCPVCGDADGFCPELQ